MGRFRAETRLFDCLRLVVAENVIFGLFQTMRPRSTFLVRLCSMSRFGAETRVFVYLRLLVDENVIFERLRAMRPKNTFHVTF